MPTGVFARVARTAPAVLLLCGVLPGAVPASPAFVHPGGLHTRADLERIREKVARGAEAWKGGFEKLQAHPQSRATWKPRGPFATVVREPGGSRHVAELAQDANAAYQN